MIQLPAFARRMVLLACFGLLAVSQSVSAAWTGAPSPHDGQHLIVLSPEKFRLLDAAAESAKPMLARDAAAPFGQGLPLAAPVRVAFDVRFDGDYQLWIRVAAPVGKLPKVQYRLRSAEGKPEFSGTLAEIAADAKRGGPQGYAAYAELAKKTGALGRFEKLAASGPGKPAIGGKDAGDLTDDLLNDIAKESGANKGQQWIHATRLETLSEAKPAHWWKIAAGQLSRGSYELSLSAENSSAETLPVFEAGLLTTSTELDYPFVDDINAPPASYVRFRIDEAPKDGVTLGGTIRIHSAPWSSAAARFSPHGLSGTQNEPHTAAGYTRWYRLQDLENAPGFGGAEAHLLLSISSADKSRAPRGATQFAVFPHDDAVLREIDWAEPESQNISMVMNFAAAPHRIRTFRDHAREHYDFALSATGGKLYPLTRGDLYFGNAWGSARGVPAQYMVKTLRLLGLNSVGDASEDPVKNRELYGWTSHAGHYWPPSYMPFDEAESRKRYDEHYATYFDRQREFYKGVSIFQIADEPGEILREEMSAPLWRYRQNKGGDDIFADVAGNSVLATKKMDYQNCVLEGKVEKHDNWFGFRAAIDDAEKPTAYAEWRLGIVSQDRSLNLATATVGTKTPSSATVTRAGAVIAATPTPFKIVYEGTSAELFVNGRRMQQLHGLPPKGGFAFIGPAKAIVELRLRPINSDEHISTSQPEIALGNGGKPSGLNLDVDDLLGDSKKTPDWAKAKPLRQAIAEDWQIAGGMPQAHAGFRAWLQEQGLQPELFGAKSWNEVRLLTVSSLVEAPEDARLFYWSRRYSGYLTPRMFAMSADAIQKHAPNPDMKGFVALSGHALYFPSAMPLDMFQLASGSPAMMPGISDWMSFGGWRWDSHQAVAYSVAMYNSGARRHGERPASFPMMHCVWPSEFRAYTMLANNVKYVSFYNFGPSYMVTEGFWSDAASSYAAVHKAANRAALVDDILSGGSMRPGRVAMLYSLSNEYWNPQSSFADKRAAFLALSHEYYQPELITEEQIEAGALEHYDALYVLEPIVKESAQQQIANWTRQGGLLWACADAAIRNEYNAPSDLLAKLAGVERKFAESAGASPLRVSPISGKSDFLPHSVAMAGVPVNVQAPSALVRAAYDDGRPAWLETPVEAGRVVYLGHRCGLTYTSKAARRGGYPVIWSDTGRELLTAPLKERRVEREFFMAEPHVVASPLSTNDGTVVVLYSMRPHELNNVEFSLREPAKPVSVQVFDDMELVDVPFDYADGLVRGTLPKLSGGQMIVVRRTPRPDDSRLADMQRRTIAQLASSDWQTLSAGAFAAGFFSEWQLSSQLLPLLKHEHWEVRRAAAEALGRLKSVPAGDALLAAIEIEPDAHALGDMLWAVGQLADRRLADVAARFAAHPQPFVRRKLFDAIVQNAGPVANREFTLRMAELGLQDLDPAVRQSGMQLLAAADPASAFELALDAFSADPRRTIADDRPAWGSIVAGQEAVFDAWQRSEFSGGDELLLAVAARKAHPAVARVLTERMAELATADPGRFISMVIRQRDPQLTRTLFAESAKLPAQIETYLPLALEHTFDARLGVVREDWERWLTAQ